MSLWSPTKFRMMWRLHWLEASGDLDPWRSTIAEEVEIARTAVAGVLPVSPPDIDKGRKILDAPAVPVMPL